MATINTSIGTLPYVHTVEYFTKGVDQGGPWYRVQYYITDFDVSNAFIAALTGEATRSGGVGGSTVRNAPHRHPLAPLLACTSASLVQGLGSPTLNANGYPSYDGGALIQAEYRAPSLEFGPAFTQNSLENSIDPTTPILWATQDIDFSSETIVRESTSTFPKYTGGPQIGEPPPGQFRYQIPLTILTLTYHKLPYMPMTTVRSLAGKVNSDVFLGAAIGCVLFKGARTTREFNTDGSMVQRAQFHFEERSSLHKWNFMQARDSFDWYLVTADGSTGGATMFQQAAFAPLAQF